MMRRIATTSESARFGQPGEITLTEGFIPAHGGYEDLLSYRKAVIVYDAAFRFCERFLDRRDRTVDQMVQAGPASRTSWKRAWRRVPPRKPKSN
jgi:hypothetical protein